MNTLLKLMSRIASPCSPRYKDTAIEMAEYISAEILPSGSGFNGGTRFDIDKSTTDKLVFHTSYHHMSEHGYYTKWTDHTVTVTPSFRGFNIKVSGRNHNDIKDYISQTFDCLLNDQTVDIDSLKQKYVEIAKSNMA